MADKKVSDLPSLNGADVDPADLLYIVDSSAGAAGSKKITVGQYQLAPVSGGTANTVVYLNGSKVESSSSALTFDGTNLGIGTSSPGAKLDVAGLALAGGDATYRGDVVIRQVGSSVTSNGGLELKVDNAASGFGARIQSTFNGTSAYDLSFQLRNNSASWTQRMLLDSSGNLGLGVTPSAWSVIKAIEIGSFRNSVFSDNGSVSVGIASGSYYNSGWKYAVTGSAVGYYELAGNEHRWFSAPSGTAGNAISFTQAMTLDASGNLLVGTTDAAINSGTGVKLKAGANNNVNAVGSDSTNTTSNYNLYSTGAAAYRFYVGMGGTIYATSTTITAISDQRLKENIRDLDAGLSEIMALKPRKFDWKAGKGKDKKGDRGWIAQEFEQVFPDMVDTWQDPAPEGEEPYKAVNADLIPVLVKAIQEQQALITDLRARVAALEAK